MLFKGALGALVVARRERTCRILFSLHSSHLLHTAMSTPAGTPAKRPAPVTDLVSSSPSKRVHLDVGNLRPALAGLDLLALYHHIRAIPSDAEMTTERVLGEFERALIEPKVCQNLAFISSPI
jgi:hypothetical protein